MGKNVKRDSFKNFLIILVFMIFLVLAFFYSSKINLEETPKKYSYEDYDKENKNYLINDSFSKVNEMHWREMPITYSLNISSLGIYSESSQSWYRDGISRNKQVKRIKEALNIIEEETEGLITFKEVSETENPKLKIQGLYDSNGTYQNYDGWEVLGVGGITDFNKNKINTGEVIFFSNYLGSYNGKCLDFPQTEIHEILHTFGFRHVYDTPNQIMFPLKISIQTCKIKEIDADTINCLKHIYSNGEIKGDCSNLNIYPYDLEYEVELKKEEEILEKKNYLWNNYPVTYSILGCEDYATDNIKNAIKEIEINALKELLIYEGDKESSNLKFYCKKYENISKESFSYETDFWLDGTPAINQEYVLEDNKIIGANISLFYYEKCLSESKYKFSEVSLMAVLRALGLREEEFLLGKGSNSVYCSGGDIRNLLISKIKML
ncbi:hypothetical protein HOE04_02095 [archaeon]|nr:hypothetical protein [archaeon]